MEELTDLKKEFSNLKLEQVNSFKHRKHHRSREKLEKP